MITNPVTTQPLNMINVPLGTNEFNYSGPQSQPFDLLLTPIVTFEIFSICSLRPFPEIRSSYSWPPLFDLSTIS